MMFSICTRWNTILGILLLCSTNGIAQTYIGFQGGGLFSRQIPNRSNIHVSIPIEWQAKKNWLSYRIELGYVEKGYEANVITVTGDLDVEQRWVHYGKAQFLWRFGIGLEEMQFYSLVGPYIASGFQARTYRLHEKGYRQALVQSFEALEIHQTDFGATIGGGLAKEIAQGVVVALDLRYVFGLRNLSTREEVNTYHESYAFTMGLFLPIKK